MSVDEQPDVLCLPGGYVLVGPGLVGYLARAMALVEREHRADGIAAPPAWARLRDASYRAAAFAVETAKARKAANMPSSRRFSSSGYVGSGRVAELLGCSEQWARARLRRGEFASARKIGGSWTVEENELQALLIAQSARDEAV